MSTSTHWTNSCHILSPVLFLRDQHNASLNLIVTIASDFRWNFSSDIEYREPKIQNYTHYISLNLHMRSVISFLYYFLIALELFFSIKKNYENPSRQTRVIKKCFLTLHIPRMRSAYVHLILFYFFIVILVAHNIVYNILNIIQNIA